jgi:hypothetical protein
MQTWGERMMISFPNVLCNIGMRYWKVSDPTARDYAGVGAFNLIRRPAYLAIGTHEKLRLEILDDLKLGEAVKRAGWRQRLVFGRGMVRLRWAHGAAGVIRNLQKNLFALFHFRLSLVLVGCIAISFFCTWPFLGLALAPGWAKAGFAVSVAMIAVSYCLSAPYTGVSPLLFLTCPIGALLFVVATLRSALTALKDGGITWRGTKYALAELRKRN